MASVTLLQAEAFNALLVHGIGGSDDGGLSKVFIAAKGVNPSSGIVPALLDLTRKMR